jgi:hypothetical protein
MKLLRDLSQQITPLQKEPPHKVKAPSKDHLLKNLTGKRILKEVQTLKILIIEIIKGQEIDVDKKTLF